MPFSTHALPLSELFETWSASNGLLSGRARNIANGLPPMVAHQPFCNSKYNLASHMHPAYQDELVHMAHATNIMRLGMDCFSCSSTVRALTVGSMPHPHSSSRSDVAVSNFPA